ncbi:hypothetical protein BpHYR1_049967 [Brachionus plicatilis]|uniref:Uncharacterized protein n=1 Tax=Brachionus plicatilis TaxID=10195 RepID=A0A3M7R5G0_BRAPC|nr:hypothetical protein BpHYR1_049967 [Brachionus plicatilis]
MNIPKYDVTLRAVDLQNFLVYSGTAYQKLVEIPFKFKNVPLAQKKKDGRPPKAKKALTKNNNN